MQEFITLPEAAKMLGVSEEAVRQAVIKDEIWGGKVGGRYYVSRQSVEVYKPREYPRDGEKQDGEKKVK